MWEWLEGLKGGAPSFVGSVTGSALGLIALVLGALLNAHLNRRRDDRLRAKDTRALAAALRAELRGRSQVVLDNEKQLQHIKSESFIVPDIAQSLRILDSSTDKLGLLDEATITDVINAHVVIEQYCDRLIIDGGKLVEGLPGGRQSVELPSALAPRVRGANLGVNDAIQKAITRLDAYLK